jgi:undecaprenyl-diphosphatase
MQLNLLPKTYTEKRPVTDRMISIRYEPDILLAIGLMVFSSVFLYFIVIHLVAAGTNLFDYNVFLFFARHHSIQLIQAAKICTFFGTGTFLIPAYLSVVIFLVKKNYSDLAYQVITAAISATLLGWILKIIFHRTRPLNHLVSGAGGFSFPSGHALGGFIFTGVFLYVIWKSGYGRFVKWSATIISCLFGLAVGLSRIYLHVHYATDVLGSFLIAVAWISLLYILFRIYHPKNDSSKNPGLSFRY